MAQLVVRNINDTVKNALRQRAKKHGHSMEEEVRDILQEAAFRHEQKPKKLGSSIASRFAGIGLTEDIPEIHGQFARPATFDD